MTLSNGILFQRRWKPFALLILLALQAPILVATARATDSPEAPASTASVKLGEETLFYVHQKVLSLSPEERARMISERLGRLAKDRLARIDSISVLESDSATDIVAGDLTLMTVTDKDAAGSGFTRQKLAAEYAGRMKSGLEGYRKESSAKGISLGIASTLLATAGLILALFLFSWAFSKFYTQVEAWKGSVIRPIKIQSLVLVPADRIVDILTGLARMAHIGLTVMVFYFYIPLAFSFFPATREYAATFFDYVFDPVKSIAGGALAYLPKLFFIVVVVIGTRYLLKLIRLFFEEIDRQRIVLPGFYNEWAYPTYQIVRFLVLAFVAVVIFPYLPGASSPAFKGISVFLGLLFSFGSSAAIGNIVSGVILTYMRPFKLGNRVQIADTVGDVIEKSLLVTRVKTIKNVEVTIPNAMVLGSHIVNFSASAGQGGLILNARVTIGYDAPWRKVHELLLAAAGATQDVLKEPPPFVLQTSLDDSYVSYEINAYTDNPNKMASTYSELHQNIQDKFNEAGVEIMSPHYSALRDGNQAALPEEHLPKNPKPRFFRFGGGPDRSGGKA